MKNQEQLEGHLDHFDLHERTRALECLATEYRDACAPEGSNVNMHFHSFFSYNARGWSPSHIAWQARKAGLHAAALCDFDVLDGLEEFLAAGRRLGLRSAVHVETRVYVKEYASGDISSPGEPGVAYIMGAGFARQPKPKTPQAEGQAAYRVRATERNLALIERINPHLEAIAIDYQADVLPLTPTGTATERHIIRAYTNKAEAVFDDPGPIAAFWAPLLKLPETEARDLIADRAKLEDVVRARLAKRGGLGYEQPSEDTFPPVQDFIDWVASCGAIPMATWLDGTSPGEADGRALLECLHAKGAAALNIIPDRNWNLSDPEEKKQKVANLNEIIAVADDMGLPVNIGTEMNKQGLPFNDDLAGEALSPHKQSFVRGARIMVGHTLLLRYANCSYIGKRAHAEFSDIAARNDFFEAVGSLPPMTERVAGQLEDEGPEKALNWFLDAVKKS